MLAAGLALGAAACATAKPEATVPPSAAASESPASAAESGVAPVLSSSVAIPFALKDQNGETRALDDYRGKVLWVSFWASWCHACKMEMSALDNVRQSLAGQPFEVLAINIDTPDKHATAVAQARALKLSYPVLFDPEKSVVSRYNPPLELPFAVLIDKAGRQRFVQRGFLPGEQADIEARIRALLSE